MFLLRTRVPAAIFGIVFVILLNGCGGAKPVTVNGKLIPPPKAKFEETDSIVLSFRQEGSQNTGSANASAKDFTFTTSLVPGKYQVFINAQPYAGTKDFENRNKQLSQMFSSMSGGSSPLSVEITAEPGQSITIDVAAGRVSKP